MREIRVYTDPRIRVTGRINELEGSADRSLTDSPDGKGISPGLFRRAQGCVSGKVFAGSEELIVYIKLDLIGIGDFIVYLRAFAVFGVIEVRCPFQDLRSTLLDFLVGGSGSDGCTVSPRRPLYTQFRRGILCRLETDHIQGPL